MKVIREFFNKNLLDQLARLSGFVKRKSKMEAMHFLLVLMFRRFDGDKLSLNDLSCELEDKFGYKITKQSIDGRFNPAAVEFIKSVINESLEEKFKGIDFSGEFLKGFTKIKLQDSTSFQLPESLKETYGGSGGKCSEALARIQFEYDIKNMDITTLEFTGGQKQDVTYSQENVDDISKGELIIRDLGYISMPFLNDLMDKEAFFVNRLHTNQVPYVKDADGNYSRLDFAGLLRKLNKKNGMRSEVQVYLKYRDGYLPMRLIAQAVPEEVYGQRIRKAEKNAKKKGRSLSDKYRLRARFNLFITNTQQEDLPQGRYCAYLYSLLGLKELSVNEP